VTVSFSGRNLNVCKQKLSWPVLRFCPVTKILILEGRSPGQNFNPWPPKQGHSALRLGMTLALLMKVSMNGGIYFRNTQHRVSFQMLVDAVYISGMWYTRTFWHQSSSSVTLKFLKNLGHLTYIGEVSWQETFYGVELWAPRPAPNLEDQWTTISLDPTLWPAWLGLTLPGAYAPASIALGVIRVRKPPDPQRMVRQGGSPWGGVVWYWKKINTSVLHTVPPTG
jgi:hypothetical protein